MKSDGLFAILRGIRPEEVVDHVRHLIDVGISRIEVPLNSPNAISSISRLAKEFRGVAVVGAGTVLNIDQVNAVAAAGGEFIVSPNVNVNVIRHTKTRSMSSMPGVCTPSECFNAIDAGADALKLFPASVLGIKGFTALKAVLPAGINVYAVGGVDLNNLSDWFASGVDGVGLGAAIYSAGQTKDVTLERAKRAKDCLSQAICDHEARS